MKRGRQSPDDLSADNVVRLGRSKPIEPPGDLTERQVQIWDQTVASEPPDLFATGAAQAMLADYCRHREAAENVSSIINTFKAEWLKVGEGAKRYAGLLRMREGETRAAASIATKLRLTNQSRFGSRTAFRMARDLPSVSKPWET